MPKARDLEFKPYVGRFFQFAERIRRQPAKAIVGRKLYGNGLKSTIRYTDETLPGSILVLDEKRNHVRFLSPDDEHFWVAKTQIVPLDVPTYDGNPIPLLEEFKAFLVYCTDTKLKDFTTDEMVRRAIDLLPKINKLIADQRIDIVPDD